MNEDKYFDTRKANIINQINDTNESNPDASPKGTLDTLLVPLIDLINGHPDMVTTSSCSGRVSVFLEGERDAKVLNKDFEKLGGKGQGGRWLFVTHDSKELDTDWWARVKSFSIEDSQYQSNSRRYILYKFEAMILHVKCRDFSTASTLYTAAVDCGFRESGIGPNNLVGIRISIKLDIPVGYLDGGMIKVLVNDDYIREIVDISRSHFEKNERKINELERRMRLMVEDKGERVETKEERRIRKREEGLLRQREERERRLKEEITKFTRDCQESNSKRLSSQQ